MRPKGGGGGGGGGGGQLLMAGVQGKVTAVPATAGHSAAVVICRDCRLGDQRGGRAVGEAAQEKVQDEENGRRPDHHEARLLDRWAPAAALPVEMSPSKTHTLRCWAAATDNGGYYYGPQQLSLAAAAPLFGGLAKVGVPIG